jgi:hypothetical protein
MMKKVPSFYGNGELFSGFGVVGFIFELSLFGNDCGDHILNFWYLTKTEYLIIFVPNPLACKLFF